VKSPTLHYLINHTLNLFNKLRILNHLVKRSCNNEFSGSIFKDIMSLFSLLYFTLIYFNILNFKDFILRRWSQHIISLKSPKILILFLIKQCVTLEDNSGWSYRSNLIQNRALLGSSSSPFINMLFLVAAMRRLLLLGETTIPAA